MRLKLVFLFLAVITATVTGQYSNDLFAGRSWSQGGTYPFDVLTIDGVNITSAIETTGNIGGAISSQWAGGQSTADTFSITWTSYTLNSGTAPNLRYTLGGNGRGSISGSLNSFWSDADKKIHFKIGSASGTFETGVTTSALTNFSVSGVKTRIKLDTLYISGGGSDAAKGNLANPIKTIAEALVRGFYPGGTFAFRSGDTFAETFTAGANTTLAVYGGTDPVTISVIDANGYTVTQSELINPAAATDTKPGYTIQSSYSRLKRY